MTPEQCLGARAMLRWTKEDLAEAAGLSVTPINSLESGRSVQESSIGALRAAFENAGIEFMEGGLRKVSHRVKVLEGKTAYLELMDTFIAQTQKGEELLLFCAKNSLSSEEVVRRKLILREQGVKFRFLVEEGDEYLNYPIQEYRYLPKEHYFNSPLLVFGDTVAICSEKVDPAVIHVFQHPAMSKALTGIFNALWEYGAMPTRTIAEKHYV